MFRVHTRAILASGLVVTAALTHAQPPDRAQSLRGQIDAIFKERAYEEPPFGPAGWLPDGSAYTIAERPPGTAQRCEIARYDAASGARTVLVSAAQLTPRGAAAPIDVEEYAWSRDGARVLIFTNARRVWRENTRGDYWVLDPVRGSLTKLGGQAPASTLMFAKFSPDGSRVAYVRENDIYVEHLGDNRIVALTRDGSADIINGTADWVYEEELSVRDGFRWSPDGRSIAYWQFDTTGVGVFSLIDNTTSLYPTITRIPYPKVGTTNSAVRIGVVPAEGGETRWVRTPGDPRNHYLARLEWVDSRTLAIQQLNRLQNRNDLLLADAATGRVRRVFRDESRTWVEVVDEVRWIDGGRAFLWISERSGWQHVYRVPREGGPAVSITRFSPDADVTDVVGTDEGGGWLYFLASPSNATERYLFRSRLDGSDAPERVTPPDRPGIHDYELAPGGRLAFHTWSQFDSPPIMEVVELPSHRSLRPLTDVSAVRSRLEEVVKEPAEFLAIDIGGGVTLDGWLLKPSWLDASRKYPVIVYVYGEPAGQTVLNRWGGAHILFHRALAEAGYIVVSIDNRGTPAPKGAAWRHVIYGSVGDLSSKEQAAAIRAIAAQRPYMDGSRIGIWGWSGGGTNTLNAMFRFPDVYSVGVAVAPMPDQRLYDTIYEERYMGLPQANPEGYRAGSAINFAAGLRGKLLIVHGTGDDNVHYQGTERLVDRLIALGKPFDMMVYPNRSHFISEGEGTTPHLYGLIARYFVDNMPPGPR
jgi:dipeptidyl-peptidase-4